MSHNVSPLESADEQQQERTTRCTYINARGHRCTIPLPDDTSDLCVNHARLLQRRELADAKKLAAELLGDDKFGSRKDFAELFLRLFDAIATKRLSRRDGAVLAYTASRALQCFPPLRPESKWVTSDGVLLNSYGLPIPKPKDYERDENGKWREVTPEEKSAREAASQAEQAQPSAQQVEDFDANETQPEPVQPAPASQPYVPPPNPHENPFGPYLTDPRPRHLRNLYPHRHRF